MKRIFYLDLIRVLAMLMIVLYHFQMQASIRTANYNGFPFGGISYNGINLGTIGVSLFFILSGSALMISKRFELKTYIKKRFLAIYPSYWLAWAAALAGTLIFMPERLSGIPLWTVCFSVIGLDGYLYETLPNFYMVGEWFIGCIVLLYIVFPLLRFFLLKRPVLSLIVTTAACAVLGVVFSGTLNLEHSFFMRIPEFMAGMFLMQKIQKIRLPAAITSAALFLLLLFLPVSWGNLFLLRYACMGVCGFIFLRWVGELCAVRLGRTQKIFSFISSISYEVFLVHHITFQLTFQLLFSGKEISTGLLAAIMLGTFVLIGGCAFLLKKVRDILVRIVKAKNE